MAKLVYKVHSERRYSTSKFPLKLRPEKDELLSSWLIRLSLLHRTMPSTFTNLYLPETKNKLWSSDLDLQADRTLIQAISEKSGIPPKCLRSMTLCDYEGYLFEKANKNTGGTQFVNPLGMRGRKSTLPGVRYCAFCLAEDEQPYFRKKWRLAISTVCIKHECLLFDRCRSCQQPLSPYISCKNGLAWFCYKCGRNIASLPPNPLQASSDLLKTTNFLYRVIDNGYLLINGRPVYSHLYFAVLHQLLKLMNSKKYGPIFCKELGLESAYLRKEKAFEQISLERQVKMLLRSVWLLEEWPWRFIEVCSRLKLLSSALLRDLQNAPFWFSSTVLSNLYYPDRIVSVEEIAEAIHYMERKKMEVSERTLSKLLGVNQVFRKRKLSLGDFTDK